MAKKSKKKKKLDLIQVTKATPYRDVMIYIRKIKARGGTIFDWVIPFAGEIYSSYLFVKKRKLSKTQIANGTRIVLNGAKSTIDHLKGDKPSKEDMELLKTIRKAGEKVWGKENGEVK